MDLVTTQSLWLSTCSTIVTISGTTSSGNALAFSAWPLLLAGLCTTCTVAGQLPPCRPLLLPDGRAEQWECGFSNDDAIAASLLGSE